MPAPPLNPTIRYFPPGTRKVYWVPTISNYLVPSRAELNAGTDLSAEVDTVTGWSLAGATVDVPDMGSRFTSQVPARLTSASSDITFYCSQDRNDVRGLLTRDTNGYIVWLWEGDVPGQKCDVFPVRITTQAMDTTVEDPGKVTISFAITRIPAISATIPA
jgi:hypothetical protein